MKTQVFLSVQNTASIMFRDNNPCASQSNQKIKEARIEILGKEISKETL